MTHLTLEASLRAVDGTSPPASAYAALTASSKLQYLHIRSCTLPAGAWEHLFQTGRQLPNLQLLNLKVVRQPSGAKPAPEGSSLVSCCPGLQALTTRLLQCSVELLAPLQELSGLRVLHVTCPDIAAQSILQAVCQLTGLRELGVGGSRRLKAEGLLLQLTQLQQLTRLHIPVGHNGHQVDLSGEGYLQVVSIELSTNGSCRLNHSLLSRLHPCLLIISCYL
jgi:hypothetical protein